LIWLANWRSGWVRPRSSDPTGSR